MALNQKERWSIKERDFRFGRKDNPTPGCQFPHTSECAKGIPCEGQLQVHHILPQMFGTVWLRAVREVLDHELNTLTICESSHVRSPQGVHNDQAKAYQEYRTDKNAFAKLQQERKELAEQGIPYWNTIFDAEMYFQAKRNTEEAHEFGWRFKRPSAAFKREMRRVV